MREVDFAGGKSTSRFFLFSHLEEQSITALSTGNREIREGG
jgi:hypothetical protein